MNPENYADLFEPFEKLIEIEIRGKQYLVPENNTLLRGFQFISMETVSYGDFCWNGDCGNCQVWLKSEDGEKCALACRTKAFEKMKISRLSAAIDLP